MTMSFADLFKKFRLRSELSSLVKFGDCLADEGYVLDNSTFSHWQNGNRVPTKRKLILAVIGVFVKREGISSLREANRFMESTGQGFLTDNERNELFKSNGNHMLRSVFFSQDLAIEPLLSQNEEKLTISSLKESRDIHWTIEDQIYRYYEKIYEGYPAIAYKNLGKLAKLIHELKLERTQRGKNLLSKIHWMRIRCLSDLTKAKDFKRASQESNRSYRFARENNTSELGPAYWMKSAIKRLEIVTHPDSFISKQETQECLEIAQLAVKHTPKSRATERFVEYLELAKIALILKNQKLFHSGMDNAISLIDSLPQNQKYLAVMAWDVQARGHLRFDDDLSSVFESIDNAQEQTKTRFQAINLYLMNTKLHALLSSPDESLHSEARKLKSELALVTSLLENPYQEIRLSNETKYVGL
jgi:hypothetical protein